MNPREHVWDSHTFRLIMEKLKWYDISRRFIGGLMEKIDQGIEATEVLEAEIDVLMRRLIETDPDGFLRIEKLLSKLRIERAVEKHCH